MTNKHDYIEFCAHESKVPLFSRPWWLDAVCDEGQWDVALVKRGGEILASMPYYRRRKLGFDLLGQPMLTPTLGPFIRYPANQQKLERKLAFEKDVLDALIEKLPPFDQFQQNFHRSLTNWLPFYWAGFEQTTRYTYVLPDLTDVERVWKGLKGSVRSDVRKAQKQLQVVQGAPLRDFYALTEKTFARQGVSTPYSFEFIQGLDRACQIHGNREIFSAVDENGVNHAAIYLVWDQHHAYYLMGGADAELRKSGAKSFLLWEAIQFASTRSAAFDFEGSMIQPIERLFRGFGAQQMPYFSISKTPSKALQARNFVKRIAQR